MRRPVGWRATPWILLLAWASGCDDDGGDSPMEPAPEPLEVTGVWVETAEITLDDCDLLPDMLTETRILEQDGTTLIANVDGVIIPGSIDPLSGAFTLELRVGDAFAIQSGRFASETSYTAETTATLANGCRFESVDEGRRESVATERDPVASGTSRFSGL